MRRLMIVMAAVMIGCVVQTGAVSVRMGVASAAAPTTSPPTTTPPSGSGDPITGGGAAGSVGSGGANASAGTGTSVPGSGSPGTAGQGGGGGGPSCTYIPSYTNEYGPPSAFDPHENPEGVAGQYYDVYCDGTLQDGPLFVPAGSPAPPGTVVDPLQLAQQALATTPFKSLLITMSPPPGREAVNFPIFLSLSGYTPISASASAGGVTSTVSVVPSTVTWDMGDGHTVTCDGPGVPYNPAVPVAAQEPPACGYVYATSSANQPGEAFQVTATVQFNATWTVTGARGGGSLGSVNRSVSIPVTVGQIEVLNQ